MIVYSYESCNGGTNNVTVAIDWDTGEWATSTKGKEAAARALRVRLRDNAQGSVDFPRYSLLGWGG